MYGFKPLQPDPFIKKPADMTIARFGHLNTVVKAIDTLEVTSLPAEDFTVAANLLTALSGSVIKTNTIDETTAASGVTVDGALIKDGSFIGKQATATATADGLTTGLLTGADQFVTVTSANADHIVALPLSSGVPIGTVIRGWVGANGFELRVSAAEAATATINGVTTSVEAAIPATTFFTVTKVASLTWILTAVTELGAVITAIIPDAVA